jgi:hypothetical protein
MAVPIYFAPPWTVGIPADKLDAARRSYTARLAIAAVVKLTAPAKKG